MAARRPSREPRTPQPARRTRSLSETQSSAPWAVAVLVHSFAETDKAARDAAGWDSCFERFDALLAGRPLDEASSLESWPAKHERYAERFGVDPELGRRTFAEHQAGEL